MLTRDHRAVSDKRAIDPTPRGLQRLYYRTVLFAVAAVLLLDVLAGLAMGRGMQFAPLEIGLYGVILLFAWFAHEMTGDAPGAHREPRGLALGIMGVLLVILCIETGGLSSAYYMLVLTTCVFGALVMRPPKAFLLTALLATLYCVSAWFYPSEGGLLDQGIVGVTTKLKQGAPADAWNTSALATHCGFLFVGTWIAMRMSTGFRAKVVTLEGDAVRDPLTGLPNRRGFMAKLEEQSIKAIHWDWPIAILVLDLDHFKKVNDRFGHPVGDEVLAAAARLLREAAGPLDNLARIGGEEFAVAAVGADRSNAADQADRIVRSFRTHPWSKMYDGLKVTVSVGVAIMQPSAFDQPITDLSELIEEADQALLQVKQHGRNGYLVAGDEAGGPPPQRKSMTARQ